MTAATEPPFDVDRTLMGRTLRWNDGQVGKVGRVTGSWSEGIVNVDAYPHIEQAAFAGRLRAVVTVDREDGMQSLTFRSLADVEAAQRIYAKTARTKGATHA